MKSQDRIPLRSLLSVPMKKKAASPWGEPAPAPQIQGYYGNYPMPSYQGGLPVPTAMPSLRGHVTAPPPATVRTAAAAPPQPRPQMGPAPAPVTIEQYQQPGALSRIASGVGNMASNALGNMGAVAGGAANAAAWAAENPGTALGAGAVTGLGALLAGRYLGVGRALGRFSRTASGKGLLAGIRRALPGGEARYNARVFNSLDNFARQKGLNIAAMNPAGVDDLVRQFSARWGGTVAPEDLASVANILKSPGADTTGLLGRLTAGRDYRRMMNTARTREMFGGNIQPESWSQWLRGVADRQPAYAPYVAGAAALHYGPRFIWGPPQPPQRQPIPITLQ